MNAHTHFVGGALAGLAAASFVSPDLALIVVATATLTAPLPDIDHPSSTYGRWIPLPGVARVHGRIEPYRRGFGGNSEASFGHVGRRTPFGIGWHRGGMHSVVASLIAAALLGGLAARLHPGWGLAVGLGTLAGMLSHLALDALNVSGQAWLWPFSNQRIRFRWPHIRVGSGGEFLVLAGLAVGLLAWGRTLIHHLLAVGGRPPF